MAALVVACGASALPEPVPLAATYRIVESLHALTPAGPRTSSLAGSVRVVGEEAVVALERGAFPRSTADALFAGPRGLTLAARGEKLSAAITSEAFRGLFRAPRGTEGGLVAVRVGDVEVVVEKGSGSGRFEERAVERYRLRLAYTLTASLPGTVQRTRVTGSGSIETVDEPAAAFPAVDDLGRLLDGPPELDEAVERALARVHGLPVSASVETKAETSSQVVGMTAAEPPARPPASTARRVRTLAELKVRPATAEDRAAVRLPADFRTTGVERLVEAQEGPR